MRKFFNSAERYLANKKPRRKTTGNELLKEKHKPSQTPDAIRARKWRKENQSRTPYMGEVIPEAQRLAAALRISELLMTQITIPDESIIWKMYEPDEVDKLVKSLHIKFLNEHESNE